MVDSVLDVKCHVRPPEPFDTRVNKLFEGFENNTKQIAQVMPNKITENLNSELQYLSILRTMKNHRQSNSF
jgi:hypothetical protein